jgi:hypothetical protein
MALLLAVVVLPAGSGGVALADTNVATQTLTYTQAGVLTVAVQNTTAALTKGSAVPLGTLTYTSTLGDAKGWTVTVAASDLVVPNFDPTKGCLPAVGCLAASSLTLTPGKVVGQNGAPTAGITVGSPAAFSGADPRPGTSLSAPLTLLTAGAGNQGTYTQEDSSVLMSGTGSYLGGTYSGTLQYTITG